VVALHFEAIVVEGILQLSDETTAVGYFSQEEIAGMDMLEPHIERINDSFVESEDAFVR